jgi:integrase
MESLHITQTKTKGYTYRRRIPQQLQELIGRKEVYRSLGYQQHEAIIKASEINQAINQALTLKQLNSVPDSIIQETLISKLGLTPTDAISSLKPAYWSNIVNLYLKQSQVTQLEYNNRKYFFTDLMPPIIKLLFKHDDIDINNFTYSKLLEVSKLLLKLPKRNIYKYRSMSIESLIRQVSTSSIEIAQNELIAVDSVNKYLKRIKSLLIFSQNLGYYKEVLPNFTIDNKQGSRGQRKEFTKNDLEAITHNLQDSPIYPIVQVSRYTGMRLSELYKCTVSEIDGVLCFDLRTPKGSPLKTLSSYRIIPSHDCLLEYIDDLPILLNKFSSHYITKRFKKDITRILDNTEGKSLYSLRHTFATDLIANGVHAEIVSELMGHAHSTMTMNRYVKGYPIETLKKAIDTLKS